MEPCRKEPVISFVPVNVSSRHDGWTAARQIAFIEALAETACVEHACRAVGMSDSAAYKLRRSTRGCLFREAWDAALDYALHRLEQAALSRALNGVARPVFHKGEQVGEWRDYASARFFGCRFNSPVPKAAISAALLRNPVRPADHATNERAWEALGAQLAPPKPDTDPEALSFAAKSRVILFASLARWAVILWGVGVL